MTAIIISEARARTKLCHLTIGTDPHDCHASGCMAWVRTLTEQHRLEISEAGKLGLPSPDYDDGYCSLLNDHHGATPLRDGLILFNGEKVK